MLNRIIHILTKKSFSLPILITFFFFISVCKWLYPFDVSKEGIYSDQANHLLQALSILETKNLKYEKADLDAYYRLGWSEIPKGLFLNSSNESFYYAKQYIYSLVLSPFIWLFGNHGPPLLNVLLLSISLFLILLYTNQSYNKNIYLKFLNIFIIVLAIIFSPAIAFTKVIHPDIFIATLLLSSFFFIVIKSNVKFYTLGMILMGMAIFEKPPFAIFLLSAFAIFYQRRVRIKHIILLLLTSILTWIIFTIPIFFSSGSVTSYQGNRLYYRIPPFIDGAQIETIDYRTDKYFYLNYYTNILKSSFNNLIYTIKYYSIGLNTGIFVYFPFTIYILFGLILNISNKKYLYKYLPIILTLLLYSISYILFLWENYYGGAGSFGNRYFLQIYLLWILICPKFTSNNRIANLFLIASLFIYLNWSMRFYNVVYSFTESLVKKNQSFSLALLKKYDLPLEISMINSIAGLKYMNTNLDDIFVYTTYNDEGNLIWSDGSSKSFFILRSKHNLINRTLLIEVLPAPIKINFYIISDSFTTKSYTSSNPKYLIYKIIDQNKIVGLNGENWYYHQFTIDAENYYQPSSHSDSDDDRILGVPIGRIELQ